MKLSKRLLLVLLAVLLCLPAWGCGKDTGEDASDIGVAPFDGRYQKNGDVCIGDNVYKEVADCPYTFETVTWTLGWVGSRKKPRKADYNAYMTDDVLLVVEDTLYCHRDHYDRFVAELQSDLQPTEVFFSFFVSLTHSYRYTLSAEQRQALVDVLATATPATAGTLLTEKDGAYAYDTGVPLIAMTDSAYLDNVQWCTLLRAGESYYLLKGYKKILLPYTLPADTLLYPVPEAYNELMKNVFLCEGGELKKSNYTHEKVGAKKRLPFLYVKMKISPLTTPVYCGRLVLSTRVDRGGCTYERDTEDPRGRVPILPDIVGE